MGAKQRKGNAASKTTSSKDKAGKNGSEGSSGSNTWLLFCVAALVVTVGVLVLRPVSNADNNDLQPQFSPTRVDVNKRHLPDPLEVIAEKFNVSILHDDPRIIQIEDFLTAEECKHIVRLGKPRMERSTAGLSRAFDQSRTSSTGWLTRGSDMADPVVAGVQQRIAEITNTPAVNQEHFQVLNYEVGQFYKSHHDFIPEMVNYPSGVRLATFFIYLSNVAKGGGTRFTKLGVTAQPKKGRAILWYNSLYNNATGNFEIDPRMDHEALAPEKGIKWAANKWIHVNDFVGPYNRGNSA